MKLQRSIPAARFSKHRTQSAFTLLEILVVLLIVGVLMGVFVVQGSRLFRRSNEQATKARIMELSNLVEQYFQVEGEYPDDRLPKGINSNGANTSAEALVYQLFQADYTGQRPKQDWLVNTDGDSTPKAMTMLDSLELFELADSWGNPILYFDSLHYGDKEIMVFAGPEEDIYEQSAGPVKNERTGLWEEPSSFQLISAGEDGDFGTEDDLSNFVKS